MYQILRRKLNHPERIYPQIILLDGGKGQISSAFKALKEKNLHDQIPILGLTKRNETIIIPQIENGEIKKWKSVNLSKNSRILKLLQRIRDESHRFAQNYYKNLHRKSTLGI
jgi:excinuclease ABC subunit C